MAKLPNDLGAQVFTDSPLRPTGAVKKPPLAAVPAEASDADGGGFAEVVPMATGDAATATDAAASRTDADQPVQQIKMTIYLSKEQVDAVEEEVYRRRRAGDRIGNTDLMREIVDGWRKRMRRRQG